MICYNKPMLLQRTTWHSTRWQKIFTVHWKADRKPA